MQQIGFFLKRYLSRQNYITINQRMQELPDFFSKMSESVLRIKKYTQKKSLKPKDLGLFYAYQLDTHRFKRRFYSGTTYVMEIMR
jgi:hypothetical protein